MFLAFFIMPYPSYISNLKLLNKKAILFSENGSMIYIAAEHA